MTLEEIYYISQIVAVIGIFASLIFVGVQIRQNSEQMKAQTRESRYGTMNQILADFQDAVNSIAHDPLSAQDYFKGHSGGLAAIAPERRAAFIFRASSALHLYERAFVQREAGRLGDDAWDMIQRQNAPMISGIGWQEIWKFRKVSYTPGFAAYLDNQIASMPTVSYEAWSIN